MSQGERKRGHESARPPRRKKKKARKKAAHEAARSIAERKAEGEIPPTCLVTMKELSRYLDVSRSTLWKLVKNGRVPHYRIGHQYRFDVVAVLGAMQPFT
jgi:excisionase family DNA binding protein